MDKSIIPVKQIDKSLSFQLVKGSNYKITDSFQKEFVVSFDEFVRISKAIFKDATEFVTVGNRILNARYVYMVEPTKELTDDQKKEKNDRAMKIGELKHQVDVLEEEMNTWKKEKMDEKFGADQWSVRTHMTELMAFSKTYWDLNKDKWEEVTKLHTQIEELSNT